MRSSLSLALLLCPLTAPAAPVQNEEPPALRKVIDKAIRARGGSEKLRRFAAITFKVQGKSFRGGTTREYSCEFANQLPERQWLRGQFEGPGRKDKVTSAIDGTHQWTVLNGTTTHTPPEGLGPWHEALYVDWVTSLRPLRSRGVVLRLLDDARVGERAAAVVEVTAKGHRPVTLFFDKENGSLLKSAARVKDIARNKEVTREEFYSAYREVQGVKLPMKIEVREDGRRSSESRRSDVNLLEKLDDKLFVEP
jgi:hypothetical protein